jgi:hypothetical protein
VIAPGLSQAQLLVLEKPGNALPSPISLPTQPNALRSRISAYYLLTPLSVRSLSKIAHILQIDCAGSVTLCSVTASFMTCYLRKTTEAPAISTHFPRRLLCRHSSGREPSDDYIDFKTNQLSCQFGKPVDLSFRRPKLKSNVLPLDIPQIA